MSVRSRRHGGACAFEEQRNKDFTSVTLVRAYHLISKDELSFV